MFGLSLAGWPVLVGVGVPIVLVLLLVLVLKLLQSRCPGVLPKKLQTWNFLPLCMRSLKPWDRAVSLYSSYCERRCCCCCRVCCRLCCRLCCLLCCPCCRCSKCCRELEEVPDIPVKAPEAFNDIAIVREAQDGAPKSPVDALDSSTASRSTAL